MTAQPQPAYYTIGQTARKLGVSIDTIRRWEKAGKITAIRGSNGSRLFDTTSIARLLPESDDDHYSVSQAANYLDVSAATLRRWDRENKLKPKRTLGNERVYTKTQLDSITPTIVEPKPTDVINPVSYLKQKAAAVSDTIVLTLIDRSIFNRYRQKLLTSGTIILVLLLSLAYNTSRQIKPQAVDQLSDNQISSAALKLAKVANQKDISQKTELYQINSQSAPIYLSEDGKSLTITITSQPNAFDTDKILVTKPLTLSPSQEKFKLLTSPTARNSLLSGTALLPALAKSVTVPAPIPSDSKIVISSNQPLDSNSIYVSAKNAGASFTVTISQPITAPVRLDWIAAE